MESLNESNAAEGMAELRNLLNSPGLPPMETDPYSFWTPTEQETARRASIIRAMKAGWKYESGLLVKDGIASKPSGMQPLYEPGDQEFNPRTNAFALRLGAKFIEPPDPFAGKYRLGGLVMDHLGRLLDTNDCPVCHGSPFNVPVLQPDPWIRTNRPWEQAFTYCRRCITREFIEENERRMQAQPPSRRPPAQG